MKKTFKQMFLEVFEQPLPEFDGEPNFEFETPDGELSKFRFDKTNPPRRLMREVFIEQVLGTELNDDNDYLVDELFQKDYRNFAEYHFRVNDSFTKSDAFKKQPQLISQIFSTAIKLIENRLKTDDPHIFVYSSDNSEPTRVRLYQAMAKRLRPKGYKLYKASNGLYTYFVFMKDSWRQERVKDFHSTRDSKDFEDTF